MKKLCNSILIAGILSSFVTVQARAQGEAPTLIVGTTPISQEHWDTVNAWLQTSAPVDAPYYAVTYYRVGYSLTHVSLVALDLASPDEEWHLISEDDTPSKVRWIGTIVIDAEYNVELFSQPTTTSASKMANIRTAAGGGSYVAFPWQPGKGVIFGARGIHGDGDYGTSGMIAVDLVSGLDFGSGAANDYVFASDTGSIDYVCSDGTTVTVRTYNSSTGDYFIYAHLLDNASLEISSSFPRGSPIGALKHGAFDDECGWAEQQDDHYHNHWMFAPAGGSFTAEDCTLVVSERKWHCGSTDVVGTGSWLIRSGSSGSIGTHDPGHTDKRTASLERSIWDYLLVGVAFIIDPFFKVTPENQGLTFIEPIYRTFELLLRLLRVFTQSNINLGPVLTYVIAALVFRGSFFLLWGISFAFKLWKSLVPFLGS